MCHLQVAMTHFIIRFVTVKTRRRRSLISDQLKTAMTVFNVKERNLFLCSTEANVLIF